MSQNVGLTHVKIKILCLSTKGIKTNFMVLQLLFGKTIIITATIVKAKCTSSISM